MPLSLLLAAALAGSPAGGVLPSLAGRWAFEGEDCGSATNWTFVADTGAQAGSFVSEELTGRWALTEGVLTLALVDHAIDEETGESGDRFAMEGPVVAVGADRFTFTVEPEVYTLIRCR